jgi:hypothetical protein
MATHAEKIRLLYDCVGLELVVRMLTFQVAYGLGLKLTDAVIEGAAESGSMQKVFWIHNQRSVTSLPKQIGSYAARSGNVKLMEWLKQRRVVFDSQTSSEAADAGKNDVLRYLEVLTAKWTRWHAMQLLTIGI